MFFVCSIGCLVCYPQVQDISNSNFIKLEREDADPIDPIDPIDRKDADPIDPIDLIDRKDEFCYATCDEI